MNKKLMNKIYRFLFNLSRKDFWDIGFDENGDPSQRWLSQLDVRKRAEKLFEELDKEEYENL